MLIPFLRRSGGTILVILLSLAATLYALAFLFVGISLPAILEGLPRIPALLSTLQPAPFRDNLVPFLAASAIMALTTRGKQQLAWLGLAALILLAALFVFSPGGPFFLPEVILLVLVTVICIVRRESVKSDSKSA